MTDLFKVRPDEIIPDSDDPVFKGKFDASMSMKLQESFRNTKNDIDLLKKAVVVSEQKVEDRIIVSNNAVDVFYDLDFAKGNVYDKISKTWLSPDAMTKMGDAAWTAGDGNGLMLDGVIGADLVYRAFAIGGDGVPDDIAGHKTDDPSADLPAGYTTYRHIAYFMTNALGRIYPFEQTGNIFSSKDYPWFDGINHQYIKTNPGTNNVSFAVVAPPEEVALITGFICNPHSEWSYIVLGPTSATLIAAMNTGDGASHKDVGRTVTVSKLIKVDADRKAKFDLNYSNTDIRVCLSAMLWVDSKI